MGNPSSEIYAESKSDRLRRGHLLSKQMRWDSRTGFKAGGAAINPLSNDLRFEYQRRALLGPPTGTKATEIVWGR
jgi:hypothetical protein